MHNSVRVVVGGVGFLQPLGLRRIIVGRARCRVGADVHQGVGEVADRLSQMLRRRGVQPRHQVLPAVIKRHPGVGGHGLGACDVTGPPAGERFVFRETPRRTTFDGRCRPRSLASAIWAESYSVLEYSDRYSVHPARASAATATTRLMMVNRPRRRDSTYTMGHS